MKARALAVRAPGEAALLELELPALGPGRFQVRTCWSGVSAGTELTFLKGTNPHLHARWDPEFGVFRHGHAGARYPIDRLGYMEVARVEQSEAPQVEAGTLVAMAYGHRDRHVADVAAERWVRLPADLDPILGVFVAHMGPICANALLHAADARAAGPRERGDADVNAALGDGVAGRRILVYGGGTVGLLVALFACQHGAAEVAVVDRTRARLLAAEALGCWAVDEGLRPPWEMVKQAWHDGHARGADVVFQCRGQDTALAESLRCLRPQGTVIDLAFYPSGAPHLNLGEEFHHNGLTIRCAQVGHVPRACDDTWDRDRLSRATLELLAQRSDAVRRHIITDVVEFEDGPALLHEIAAHRRDVIQAVLQC